MAQTAHITADGIEKIDKNGKSKKKRNDGDTRDFRPGYYGPDYEKRKAELHKEINSSVMTNENGELSFERFAKTPEEKERAKVIVARHKALLRSYGIDPKKQMNIHPDDLKNYVGFRPEDNKKQLHKKSFKKEK